MDAKLVEAGQKMSGDTSGRILDVAERLFAEHGFEATSMRMITSQAQVNLAAVNYHFGSKEALFQDVFRRRLTQLNAERMVLLNHLEGGAPDAVLKPSQVLEAFFGPALEMAADVAGGGRVFMRLLGRTYTEPSQFIRQFMALEYAEVMDRYTVALYRALPDVPVSEILWRLHFMMGAVSYAISGIDALALLSDQIDDDPVMLKSRLSAFLLGGLRAPLPEAATQ